MQCTQTSSSSVARLSDPSSRTFSRTDDKKGLELASSFLLSLHSQKLPTTTKNTPFQMEMPTTTTAATSLSLATTITFSCAIAIATQQQQARGRKIYCSRTLGGASRVFEAPLNRRFRVAAPSSSTLSPRNTLYGFVVAAVTAALGLDA